MSESKALGDIFRGLSVLTLGCGEISKAIARSATLVVACDVDPDGGMSEHNIVPLDREDVGKLAMRYQAAVIERSLSVADDLAFALTFVTDAPRLIALRDSLEGHLWIARFSEGIQ